MDAHAFLSQATETKPQPVYVLYGDESFLKRRVRSAVLALCLGDADPEYAVSHHLGVGLMDFATLRDELDTLPFLAARRVVVVEQADDFVTKYRPQLERFVSVPSTVGVLILEVKTFPATTKLAKALPDRAKIECKAPSGAKLLSWCTTLAAERDKQLPRETAEWLLEMIGPDLGQLDQEIAKLATASGSTRVLSVELADRLVGRSRGADVFRIFDAIAAGRTADALSILDRLLEQGEEPIAILSGPLSYQLRRVVQVGRLMRQGRSAAEAMDEVNVPAWPAARQGIEALIRHLGWPRVDRLHDWLLEIDVGLKGGNPLPPRTQLERLIVHLARPLPTNRPA